MSRPLLLASLLLAGCSDGDTGTSADTDSGPTSTCEGVASAELTVPPGDARGLVPIDVLLTHPDAVTVERVDLYFTPPDGTWQRMTLQTSAERLASSAEGTPHTLVWDARADLGSGRFEDVPVRAVVRSEDCNPWPPADRTLTVDNGDETTDTCTITSRMGSGEVEGKVTLAFTLAHPSATAASVAVRWSTGDLSGRATLAAADCDGDSVIDQTTELELSPAGVEHCLVWDSEQDLNLDTEVSLTVDCVVGSATAVSAEIGPVALRNDLAPDPGELVISEVMALPLATEGYYVELRSVAGHALDLAGLSLSRWRSVTPRTSAADRTFEITPPTGALVVHPGELVLLASSDDPASSGCRRPDHVWSSEFSLRSDSTLVLHQGQLVITELSFHAADGWSFAEGVAWGVDPTRHDTPDHAARTSWCPQTTAIEGCVEVPETDEAGTPGGANDACPGL
jgi:hypothetical protein